MEPGVREMLVAGFGDCGHFARRVGGAVVVCADRGGDREETES